MIRMLVNLRAIGNFARQENICAHFEKFGIGLSGYSSNTPDGYRFSDIKLLLTGDQTSIEAAINDTDCEVKSCERLRSMRQLLLNV